MSTPGEFHHDDAEPLQPDPSSLPESANEGATAMNGLQYLMDRAWNNSWTFHVEASRERLKKTRHVQNAQQHEETIERLSKLPITPINNLVNVLDPNADGAVPCGAQGYYNMQTDEHWMGLLELMPDNPRYTETDLSNVGYTAMVRLLGWHNLDERREEQVSARSLLGSHRDQPKVPLTMFGVHVPLLDVRPSPTYMCDPRSVATALAVDTELRAAGLLMRQGGRRQRAEAQIYLELMPPKKRNEV